MYYEINLSCHWNNTHRDASFRMQKVSNDGVLIIVSSRI